MRNVVAWVTVAVAAIGLGRVTDADGKAESMQKVRLSADGGRFVLGESGKTFLPWGFNYLGEFGDLVEDSWDRDWERLERDFGEMRKLGANVVRIHLQFGTYMTGRDEFDQAQLDRLRKLLDLAQENRLYVDVTGLSCYRLSDIPDWYDALDEADRWEVQSRWWKSIAGVCAGHPAVFCYDLMNEPVIGGAADDEPRWVGGELGGFYFVQRISRSPGERTSRQIADAWSAKLTAAIREQDPEALITVGVIPWAQVWPNAKPLFYSPDVGRHFDFVSIHSYPEGGQVDRAVEALGVYDLGKPLVVEETFPLSCTLEEMDQFVEGGKERVDGWISHYFGHTIEEHERGAEPLGVADDAPFGTTVAKFLAWWRDKGESLTEESAAAPVEEDGSSSDRPQSSRRAEPATSAAPVIRGSVEQIAIAGAVRNCKVVVSGPGGFQAEGTTDESGGLVVRDVPPGAGYVVNVAERDGPEQTVRVLARDQHPTVEFYAAQTLDASRGYVETRDGTLLAYRAVLPDRELYGAGPYDLLITYSGYQPGLETKNGYQNRPFEQFSALGYAVVGVNMRGSGCSGGRFDFMEPLTWLDGYDVVEAFSAQEWVDDVALGDQSWPGLTQLYVASTRPPSLDAIVAGSVVGDFYRDVFYPGGIPNVGFGRIWAAGRDAENANPSSRKEVRARVDSDPICAANQALRSQNVGLVDTIQAHPYDDEFWQGRSAERLVGRITVPTLQIVSWQDAQVGSRPATLFERYADDVPVRLVGVNGFHQYWSGAVWDEVVEFLDVYLGDSTDAEIAEYEAQDDIVVLLESDAAGEVRGRMTLPGFGAAGDGRRLTLGSDLTPDDADASKTLSTFHYAPTPPGSWNKPVQEGAAFSSAALSEQTVMAGGGSVDLWMAAEAADVDLQVTLSEVRPDGQEMLIQSGWLRASHRALDEKESTVLRPRQLHTAESIEPLTPGAWTFVRVELFPFAHVFRPGSRIRLAVSGPGGGSNAWPWAFDALPGGFNVSIAHDGKERSSSVVLPVVAATDLDLPAELPDCEGVWLQPCRQLDEAN